jgi:hypothetical protein
VKKPMLSTTNARAAATITKAISTIALSIPTIPLLEVGVEGLLEPRETLS